MPRHKSFSPAMLDELSRGRLPDPHTPGLLLEVLPSGKKRWEYRRRLPSTEVTVKMWLGLYPAHPIAAARDWAGKLNEQVEAGVDPREARGPLKHGVDGGGTGARALHAGRAGGTGVARQAEKQAADDLRQA